MRFSRRIIVLAAPPVGALLVAIAALAGAQRAPMSVADEGIQAFTLADFGGLSRATLETNALPYKVVATALLIREERVRGVTLGAADLPAVFRQFGFIYPDRIANWPASVALPQFRRPVGMLAKDVVGPTPLVRIDAVNLGCTTCHAGVLYDSTGRATNEVWVGAPSTSINLEAYTQAVFIALANASRDQGAFRARIGALFPEMGTREALTLRFLVLPRVAKRIAQLRDSGGALPFSNGGAGRTNGVATLKRMLGIPPGIVTGHADVGFTSIPELSGRGFRSSLLYDGTYAPIGGSRFEEPFDSSKVTTAHLDSLAGIIAFFTVSTMGAQPDVGELAVPAMRPVMQWIGRRYQSPPFPGRIDDALQREGAEVYSRRCASCHGTYGEGRPRPLLSFPNTLIEQSAMNTDSSRWAMIDSATVAAIGASAYERHMRTRRTGGYVAPILSGIWESAPYLHNGSVPTLATLLTPSERPVRFLAGGHALDYRAMGIAGVTWTDSTMRYPAGYVPWAIPELVDTRTPGMSNRGHERQSLGMSAHDKLAVIEYLKTL